MNFCCQMYLAVNYCDHALCIAIPSLSFYVELCRATNIYIYNIGITLCGVCLCVCVCLHMYLRPSICCTFFGSHSLMVLFLVVTLYSNSFQLVKAAEWILTKLAGGPWVITSVFSFWGSKVKVNIEISRKMFLYPGSAIVLSIATMLYFLIKKSNVKVTVIFDFVVEKFASTPTLMVLKFSYCPQPEEGLYINLGVKRSKVRFHICYCNSCICPV